MKVFTYKTCIVSGLQKEGDLLTHAAARENHIGVVQLLNDWGADWLRPDGVSQTTHLFDSLEREARNFNNL